MSKEKRLFLVILFSIFLFSFYGIAQNEENSSESSSLNQTEKREQNPNPRSSIDKEEAKKEKEGVSSQDKRIPDETGAYVVRLKDLQQRINRLKEQIFRSKSRLSLLSETVLQGSIAGAKAIVIFKNGMGGSFKLVKALISLDGAPILNKMSEAGVIDNGEEIQLFNGSIVPGEHILNVNLEYRGHGYGIFSYLKGYRFRVRSSHAFTAVEGKTITVKIEGYEKGGPMTPLEERPAIRYMEKVQSGLGEESGKGTTIPEEE